MNDWRCTPFASMRATIEHEISLFGFGSQALEPADADPAFDQASVLLNKPNNYGNLLRRRCDGTALGRK